MSNRGQNPIFKMWLKSTHDQKLEIFYSLRPEDGLHGSNETKKCEIRPVVSSIATAFQSFQVLFYIYNIYKIGLENFEMHDWGNYRADFRIFCSFEPYSPSSGLGLKIFSNFWSCIDLGHILKNRVLAPIASTVKTSKEIFFSNSAKLQHIFK